MIIKQRVKAGAIERMDLVGTVDGCDAIIGAEECCDFLAGLHLSDGYRASMVAVDDMIDTAGTLCTAAANLKANGANRVFAFASHGLFSGPASDRILRSDLEEVVVTNTIPLRAGSKANDKIVSLSVAA